MLIEGACFSVLDTSVVAATVLRRFLLLKMPIIVPLFQFIVRTSKLFSVYCQVAIEMTSPVIAFECVSLVEQLKDRSSNRWCFLPLNSWVSQAQDEGKAWVGQASSVMTSRKQCKNNIQVSTHLVSYWWSSGQEARGVVRKSGSINPSDEGVENSLEYHFSKFPVVLSLNLYIIWLLWK